MEKLYDEHEHEDVDDFVFVVKDTDGKLRVSAYHNIAGGTCGCCCELDVNDCDVIKIYNGITLEVVFSE